ncbi:MAG TPA: sensor histidine kinase, partial [Pedobacter sp.]|uniref:sensor histidine kinase n=1 Tax=Pedobacter sp. TaxID=1411316 RepID=UPI002C64EF90
HVLMNLLSNAIKYSPGGGTITLGCTVKQRKVKIYVSDEGVGISHADQQRLFERFYRVNNDKLRSISGFGIGLFLASEILRYHNSKIQVESKEGLGSTFYFYLDL